MTLTPPTLTLENIKDALRIYVALAWNDDPVARSRVHHLMNETDLDDALASFCDESLESEGCRKRWVIRLGNRAYPHMKFVIEDSGVGGRLYFCADTHDQVSVNTNVLGLEAWADIQAQNATYKRMIEEAWYQRGLPTMKSVRESTGSIKKNRVGGAGPKVLVVDDEVDAAQLFSMLLAHAGFSVSTSNDGEEAIDMVRRQRPDVVLLDYMMDGLSGREVCEILKDDPNTSQIPVIISTYADVDQHCLKIADAVLPKPFRTDELVNLIGTLLRPVHARSGA